MQHTWTDILISSAQQVADRLASIAPQVLAALTLALVGLAVAAALRRLTVRLLQAVDLDGRCARQGVTATLGRAGIRQPPSEMVGRLVFWVVLVVGLLMAIEALEVPAAAGLAPVVIRFLPSVLVAVLVMIIGWLVANFLAQALLIFVVNAQLGGGPVLAGAVRWLILLFAASLALTQLGIAREMVLLVFGILFGGAVFGLALAFGLGGRELAARALECWLGQPKPDADRSDGVSHL